MGLAPGVGESRRGVPGDLELQTLDHVLLHHFVLYVLKCQMVERHRGIWPDRAL